MFADAKRIRVAVVAATIVYAALFVWTAVVVQRNATTQRVRGWAGSLHSPQAVLTVVPGGPADGKLQVGDKIIAVGSDSSFRGHDLPSFIVSSYPAETPYQLTIVRGLQKLKVNLRIHTGHSREWVPVIVLMMAGSLVFMACGLLMGWKRPDLRMAQIGWAACLLGALVYLSFSLQLTGSLSHAWRVLTLGSFWQYFAAYCFVASFGAVGQESSGWRWFRRVLLVYCFGLAVNHFVSQVITPWNRPVLRIYPSWLVNAVPYLITLFYLLVAAGTIAVLVRNYRRSESSADRRRIELVGGAVAVGLGIVAVCGGMEALRPSGFTTMAIVVGNFCAMGIPIVFCYAVVAHQVMEIRVIIRRGLQYLLAKQVLRVLLLLPFLLIAEYALRHQSAPIGSTLNLSGLAVMLIAVLCLEWRDVILAAVDRWFFRERFDRDKLMLELLGEIGKATSVGHIVTLTRNRVMSLFAAEYVLVTGSRPTIAVVEHADGELALPLRNLDGEVSGWLYIGPRRSDETYTAADKDLLEMVAVQIGLKRDMLSPEGKERMIAYAIDQERTRIAQELHDTVGQGFAGISLYLNAAGKSLSHSPEMVGEFLEAARNIAKISAQETRDSLRGLRTPTAGGRHLEARLRGIAYRFVDDKQVSPSFALDISEGICEFATDDVGWHLARVAEEAVTNACKHASAKQIRVRLDARGGNFELRVIDDGVGFEPATKAPTGLGLQGMRERMASVHGSVQIQSQPGKGTEVFALVPFAAASA